MLQDQSSIWIGPGQLARLQPAATNQNQLILVGQRSQWIGRFIGIVYNAKECLIIDIYPSLPVHVPQTFVIKHTAEAA